MTISSAEKEEAIKSITTSAQLDISYLKINGIALIVACSGLMANSTAVIIGSMLIATLLSPVAGTALAVTNNNRPVILNGLKTLCPGVLLVMAIAFVYGLLFPHIEATDRMLARTAPGIFDFLIAFFGGIATALVPPLSTAGIFFSKGMFDLGFKAFELAAINIIFILFANFIVFKYFKLSYKSHE